MDKKRIEGLAAYATRLRRHCLEMTAVAGSGHPTSCLSCAEIMAVLFFSEMHYNPHVPRGDADEFVLSKGHAAPILYAALAEAGAFEKKMLFTLRKLESFLEGHPVPRCPWVKVATGSLGQGLSVGVGMALAQRIRASQRRVFVLLGDGELAEGSVWEAMNLAAHYKLRNLVAIVDQNRLGQSGETLHGWKSEVYKKKAGAFGWKAQVVDGHNIRELLDAFSSAKKSDVPAMIIARTVKGKGVSFLEDRVEWHGKTLSRTECHRALKELKVPKKETGAIAFVQVIPDEYHPFFVSISEPAYKKGELVATRDAYGAVLKKIGLANKDVVVLDGDVKNSTRSEMFKVACPERFIESYIAEQNMVSMAAGLAVKGKHPFVSTFAAFLTRAYDQIRMANYSRLSLALVGSHAGVSIGQDGPSQMGIEDLAMMRALPNTVVLYPCDAVSCERLTVIAKQYAGVSYLRTTREKTPVLYDNKDTFHIGGSRVVYHRDDARIALIAAGITVHRALDAAHVLVKKNIPVVVIDCYSIKPLDRDRLFDVTNTIKKMITVEDHSIDGGLGDAVASVVSGRAQVFKVGVTGIPRSGTPAELFDFFGLSSRAIVELVEKIMR